MWAVDIKNFKRHVSGKRGLVVLNDVSLLFPVVSQPLCNPKQQIHKNLHQPSVTAAYKFSLHLCCNFPGSSKRKPFLRAAGHRNCVIFSSVFKKRTLSVSFSILSNCFQNLKLAVFRSAKELAVENDK